MDTLFDDVKRSFNSMILSASGFRKVFAENGDEESRETEISCEDVYLVSTLALTFGETVYKLKDFNKEKLTIAIGSDSRPTGKVISDIFIKSLLSQNFNIKYVGISAAPEFFSYSMIDKDVDAFVYVSASHNPIGHNGFKFGLSNGGVLDKEEADKVIKNFKENILDFEVVEKAFSLYKNCPEDRYSSVISNRDFNKNLALKYYNNFSKLIFSGVDDLSEAENNFSIPENLLEKIKNSSIAVISEFNGSARAASIDTDFLNSLGVTTKRENDTVGKIVHRIVPEGESLLPCCKILEEEHKKNSNFILGYVPDNDGDRGNIVYFDEKEKKAKILEAQDVFALVVLSELAFLEYINKSNNKIAVCVNGPTSNRIDEVCKAYKADIFRAEVGEANVVNLARKLRKNGYTVRVLGEGSNGGNITHPAAVRDPLNTLGSIIKILSIPELFKSWSKKIGIQFKEEYTITDIIESLPKYVTTSAYEDDAIVAITSSQKDLKANYEKLFPSFWEENKKELFEKLNITYWEELNYEGMETKVGVGSKFRSGNETGGLKIIFYNEKKEQVAYFWMRGSGTEPVFRILVDVKSNNPKIEKELLAMHTNLVLKADKL